MRHFPILHIPPHVLERVFPKLKEKEYFRIQQTCKYVERFVRSNKKIKINVKRHCPITMPRTVMTRRMSTVINRKYAAVAGIYGVRFKSVELPYNIPDFPMFTQYLKEHRISTEELSLYSPCHRYSREYCADLFKVMKPTRVSLYSRDSNNFEALYQHKELKRLFLAIDCNRVADVVEKFIPRLWELRIKTKASQDEIYDIILSFIKVIEKTPRSEAFKAFKFCAKWASTPVPTLEKLLEAFRDYSPRALEHADASKDYKKILCNLSDKDTFFNIRIDGTSVFVNLC